MQVLPFTDAVVPAAFDVAGQDVDELPRVLPPAGDEPAFVLGSYKLARIARGLGFSPGAFFDGLRYSEWSEGWGHRRLLNPHAWIGPLSEAAVSTQVFMRPNADSKEFPGRVFNRSGFYAWRKRTTEEGVEHVPANTEVLIASVVRDIHYEARVWIVDGEIVTASLYKRGGRAFVSDQVDREALWFAAGAVHDWCPSPAFVLDVAKTADGMKIVEANCLSAAGFYAGDMQRLVVALEDYFQRHRS